MNITEQNKGIVATLALLALQGVVGWSIHVSAECMKLNWETIIAGRSLPSLTYVALQYGAYIPIFVGVCSIFILFSIIRTAHPCANWLWPLAIVEIAAICLFVVGITLPASYITYSLGP